AAAQHSCLLDGLAELLRDRDSGVQQEALEAVGRLGAAATQHPYLLNYLAELLRDPMRLVRSAILRLNFSSAEIAYYGLDGGVRRAEAEPRGGVAPAATKHPFVLDGLAKLLRDHVPDVRVAAARAVRDCGPAFGQHGNLLTRLAELLHDPEEDVRRQATDEIV